jgi:hypothetical protein
LPAPIFQQVVGKFSEGLESLNVKVEEKWWEKNNLHKMGKKKVVKYDPGWMGG